MLPYVYLNGEIYLRLRPEQVVQDSKYVIVNLPVYSPDIQVISADCTICTLLALAHTLVLTLTVPVTTIDAL